MVSLLPQTLGGGRDNIWNILYNRFFSYPSVDPNRHPLLRHCLKEKPNRILEIGFGDGETSVKINNISNPHRHVVVDIFDEYLDIKQEAGKKWDNVEKLIDKVEFKVGDSREILPKLNGPFDLIFIDGNHSYEFVKKDWENTKNLIHKKSVVFFHDYGNTDGVTKCFDKISDKYNKNVIETKFGNPSFGVIKPRSSL
jgi:predicted O-methyltransferase YrrM